MLLRSMGLFAPVVAGGVWVSGAFDGAAYSKDFQRPPEEVEAALSDLDISGLSGPGSPFTSFPPIRMSRSENAIHWTIMSGNEVAMTMTARLAPLNGGAATRVTGTVERGYLSNPASVAPAVYQPGAMETIFAMALEAELATMSTSQNAASAAQAEHNRRMAQGMMTAAQIAANPDVMRRDIARIAESIRDVQMAATAPPAMQPTNFRPGEPIVDVRRPSGN